MATSIDDEWDDSSEVGWGSAAANLKSVACNDEWDDKPKSRGFGGGFGQSNTIQGSRGSGFRSHDGDNRGFKRGFQGDDDKNNRGFGRQDEGGFRNGGRGGFQSESRGFGRSQDDESSSRGFGGGRQSESQGFGRNQNDNESDGRGFGGGRGGGRGGSRGFGRNQDDAEMSESRGFGGGRGNRGFGRNQDDAESGSRGFGGGRGGNRGFDRNQDDAESESRGFGGGRGGGFGRNQDDAESGSRGFGGGRGGNRGFGRNQDDAESESRGFGGGRGGGFGRNQDDNESEGRGFGGRRGGRNGFRDENEGERGFGGRGGHADGDDEGDGEKPRPERYIPPEDPTDEKEIFGTNIQSGINFAKYDKIDVKVSGSKPPSAIQKFEDANLRPILIENIVKSGYIKPTPVQKSAIPIIMSGRDLMACAQTGSGKTAAFLLPILHTLLADPQECVVTPDGACLPQCIVLSPTRELTSQIFLEARKFSVGSIIKCCVCYGGTSTYHQTQVIMRGCHVLVATPGRMHDLVNRGRLSFDNVRFLVLDEADRMLDMGFRTEIEKVLSHSGSGQRQTLMFSATFPNEIQHLAGNFLNDYLFLTVGIVGGANNDVEQTFYQVPKFQKRTKLKELLEENSDKKAMVFVETKRNADFIAAFLSENKLLTTSIHGDRLQREREEALKDFRIGRMNVLVATAVAARGLDIKNVEYVVNYDLPKTIDEYVHRIGRTGRVGNQGFASSLYDPEQDREIAGDLVKCLAQANQDIPEFLQQEAGTSISNYAASSFGGSDVRRMGGGAAATVASSNMPAEAEEW